MALETVIVVGGSLAGIRTAEALRRKGFDGRLVLVGDEEERPYDRPPLSKELLRGDREPEQIRLTKPDAFDRLGLDLRLGVRAESLDPAARRVALSSGESLGYDALVIATGARARELPGAPALAGLFTLRSLADALAIRAELERGPRVAVVGAGFIGAEVAATCRARGLDVALVEPLATPMARVLAPEIGGVCAAAHRDHGVDLRLGVGVAAVEGSGRVERLLLSDGSKLAADVVVVGIGAVPATGWLESSGLALDDGVVCDAHCATAAPGVFAAGDVARWFHSGYGEPLRIEHWTNAVEQSEAVAAALLGGGQGPAPFAPIPFVWSDQYDLKIQAAGRIAPDDEVFVAHGSLAERRFVALFGRKGQLRGALAINRVRQLMGYRRMMRDGGSFEAAVAAAQQADRPSGGSIPPAARRAGESRRPSRRLPASLPLQIPPHDADDAARERLVGPQEPAPDDLAAVDLERRRLVAVELVDVRVVLGVAERVHDLAVVDEPRRRDDDAGLLGELARRGSGQRLAALAASGREREPAAVGVLDQEHAPGVPYRDVRALDHRPAHEPPGELQPVADAHRDAPERIAARAAASAHGARSGQRRSSNVPLTPTMPTSGPRDVCTHRARRM